ncbi:MAG TPA: DUF2062 domain-containing protein, partial [Pseudomonadales bacterium]|nr:DUF2062 domain-containing protein [Pseudomonadales bacterium]
AFLLTLMSNPLTFAPIAFMDFTIGRWFLASPDIELTKLLNDLGLVTDELTKALRQFAFGEIGLAQVSEKMATLWELFWQPILKPFALGATVLGLGVGATGYFGVHLAWRWHVSQAWKQRTQRRIHTTID